MVGLARLVEGAGGAAEREVGQLGREGLLVGHAEHLVDHRDGGRAQQLVAGLGEGRLERLHLHAERAQLLVVALRRGEAAHNA